MKKKFGLISALACLGITCFAAGCTAGNELEQYQEKGYNISVTYDANGGSFTGRTGVTLMDLFNPSKYEADENGLSHIKLLEPTDPSRQAGGSEVTLTMSGHFFAGWYHTREVVTNEAGKPVDVLGKELEEKDGLYYYVGTDQTATPVYTYDGYWDFEKDLLYSASEGTLGWEEEGELVYSANDGLYNLTLYAGWVPNYTFEYYYQNPEDEQDWTLLKTTTFNYKATNAENSDTYDWDTIWLPDWKDGAMNHSYRYANQQLYEFPKIDGYTFSKAYTDPECTQQITESSFTHTGTLDVEKCIALNPVQKIYIVADKGEFYKISKAEQLSANANLSGNYEILADLDFKNGEVRWPASFVHGTFSGAIYSTAGQNYKISNVKATASSTVASVGGLFGRINAGARIENVTFENVTLSFDNVLSSKSEDEEAFYGLFAGYVEDDATVTSVTVGGEIRLGAVNNWKNSYDLHLIGNGNVAGVTKTSVNISVFGAFLWEDEGVDYYEYVVDHTTVAVSAEGYVTMGLISTTNEVTQAEYYIGQF